MTLEQSERGLHDGHFLIVHNELLHGGALLIQLATSIFRYQISWTTEVKHAKTGDHEVNLYDEEGYTAAKRALESGEGSAVKPLVTIVVNYPGAYKGPWINSELLAAALSILVFYLAYSSKSALLA